MDWLDEYNGLTYSIVVAENRLKLSSITATVIFCGQQALAFRGYRDDGPVPLDDSTFNRRNFQALLKFRVDAGDEVLKEHIETSAHNAMYSSKETQNRMIVICGHIIRKIWMKIREAKYFSIIADEATNFANNELLLRLIDKKIVFSVTHN